MHVCIARWKQVGFRQRGQVIVAVNQHEVFGELAAAMDQAPAWTLDQIAGLVFGGVLVAFYFTSQQIDELVAAGQRRHLGLCERCGGLYESSTCRQKDCPGKRRRLLDE